MMTQPNKILKGLKNTRDESYTLLTQMEQIQDGLLLRRVLSGVDSKYRISLVETASNAQLLPMTDLELVKLILSRLNHETPLMLREKINLFPLWRPHVTFILSMLQLSLESHTNLFMMTLQEKLKTSRSEILPKELTMVQTISWDGLY